MARWHLNLAQLRAQTPLFQRSAVAVGNFDGVHKGHASILRLAVERAGRAAGETPIALTFDPHPRAVVGLGAPEALTTGDERDRIILGLGIEAVVTLRFDADVAGLPPETFVREVLLDGLGARRVVVGDNFRFGRGARGTTDLLEQLGRELGFSVHVAPTVRSDDGRVVSSTLVARAIRAGDVAAAAAFTPTALLSQRTSSRGRRGSVGRRAASHRHTGGSDAAARGGCMTYSCTSRAPSWTRCRPKRSSSMVMAMSAAASLFGGRTRWRRPSGASSAYNL